MQAISSGSLAVTIALNSCSATVIGSAARYHTAISTMIRMLARYREVFYSAIIVTSLALVSHHLVSEHLRSLLKA
jgi:hypothetical protein